MSLPHLAPVHGVRANAAYTANLRLIHPPLKGAAERKAAAIVELKAEVRLKRIVDRTDAVLTRLEERTAAYDVEIKALQKRKSFALARAARIEDEAITRMEDAGVQAIAGIRASLRLQLAPQALTVTDQTKIPPEFLRQPKTPPKEPDKVALKKVFAADDELDPADYGCSLSQKVSLVRT